MHSWTSGYSLKGFLVYLCRCGLAHNCLDISVALSPKKPHGGGYAFQPLLYVLYLLEPQTEGLWLVGLEETEI